MGVDGGMDMGMNPRPTVVDARSLRRLRTTHGWSQRELARAADVNSSIVSRLERGLQMSVDAGVLVALARALGVGVEDLLVVRGEGQERASLDLELAVEVARLSELSIARQRHVAALLRANRVAFPDQMDADDT